MNKVDTVSLINMILPKPDTSKGSWGDSAFKDIFSINNSSNSKSNNKPNKSTKDIYSDNQNVDKNLQASKRKDFKSESPIKPKEAKDKLQNDSISNNKQNEKQMSETENTSSVSPVAESNNNEAEASGLIEPEVTINDQANQNPVDIPEKLAELIQSLMSANLNPEQLDKVTEAIKILPEEIKAMIQENPKMALDFLKDNLNFLAKTAETSSLVVVFPLVPVMPITGISKCLLCSLAISLNVVRQSSTRMILSFPSTAYSFSSMIA